MTHTHTHTHTHTNTPKHILTKRWIKTEHKNWNQNKTESTHGEQNHHDRLKKVEIRFFLPGYGLIHREGRGEIVAMLAETTPFGKPLLR